jgi:DNA-binding response OmpR family regulator
MKRILIIDDDPVFATICANLLLEVGYQVEIAEDGAKGVEVLRSQQPDLILLDLHMRKMNGVQVLKYIRSRAASNSTPVIAFSSAASSRLVEPVWDAGVNRFLAKDHFEPDLFIKLVRETMAPAPVASLQPPGPNPPSVQATQPAQPALLPADSFAVRIEAFAALQLELRRSFLEEIPPTLNAIRNRWQAVIKAGDLGSRGAALLELSETIGLLPQHAGIVRFSGLEHFSRLLESLLEELQGGPEHINSSSLHTVTRAVEFLGKLFEQATAPKLERPASALALVVDDDSASRRMMGTALELANIKSIRLDDPQLAFRVLEENRIGLILLNLQKPTNNGLELFATIRALPTNDTTPVVFVTSLSDFESRIRSTLAVTDDFIASPFLPSELAIKALAHVLRGEAKILAEAPKS